MDGKEKIILVLAVVAILCLTAGFVKWMATDDGFMTPLEKAEAMARVRILFH